MAEEGMEELLSNAPGEEASEEVSEDAFDAMLSEESAN